MNTNLSNKLKNLRKSLNMSPTQVIALLKKSKLNYSIQSLYKWEQGKTLPNIYVIEALAKIYNCNISYLVSNENITYLNLTPKELFLLRLFRQDILFRNIALQILEKLDIN